MENIQKLTVCLQDLTYNNNGNYQSAMNQLYFVYNHVDYILRLYGV